MSAKRIVTIMGISAVGSYVCVALFIAAGMPIRVWMISSGAMLLAVAITVALVRWRVSGAHARLRREFHSQRSIDLADPLVAALSQAWKEPDRLPKLEAVREALSAIKEAGGEKNADLQRANRARIICFGQAEVPEVGRLHFEPEIITPTGAVWRQLLWLAVAGIPLAWCLLDYLHKLPAWIPGARAMLGGFLYFFVAGALALGVWIWKGMIRPTYLRLAPGIIQVLEFRYSKSRPTIRSYPMQSGTLVLFTRIRQHAFLTLSCGEYKDSLAFSRMQHPQHYIEQAWKALLSTAPTPPLSEDELVG